MAIPPRIWVFNEADQEAYAGWYWRCPTRLATGGLLAELWRAPRTRRGGGTVTSVLPVLALHAWPGQAGAEAGWTGWKYLSQRRVATLAGLNKDSVAMAYRRLVARKLMELDQRPRTKYEGGRKTYYRLAAALYPREGEPYAVLPGNLLYGGTWALLPTAAMRHLYLVISGLDPIRDEKAYLRRIAEDVGEDWDEGSYDDALRDPDDREPTVQEETLATQRARHPLSIRDLVACSGLHRGTVIEALRALLEPIIGDEIDELTGDDQPHIALLKRGEVRSGRPTWYAVDRRAWDWCWSCELMNDPEQLLKIRESLWPYIAFR
jgi:hypothetical protein